MGVKSSLSNNTLCIGGWGALLFSGASAAPPSVPICFLVAIGYILMRLVIVSTTRKTGDIGQLDDEGYLYLTGRIDDLINVAGDKVLPEEVERIVKLLTGVEEVVAIGTKHDIFGQVVKLFVKRSVGSSLEKSEIISHCIKNLERYKVPSLIQFVDDFPRTEYGKIKRFMLE